MKYKDRFTKPRILAMVLTSIVPLTFIITGMIQCMDGLITRWAYWILYAVLPVIALGLLFLVIFSRWPVWAKTMALVFMLVSFMLTILFLSVLFPGKWILVYRNDDVLAPYEDMKSEYIYMPELTELGDTQELKYYDYVQSGVFTDEADALFCSYSKEEYDRQKSDLSERYIFQSEPWDNDSDIGDCEPFAEVDGFFFRTLSVDGEYGKEVYYPKRLIFIGTNDETCEIVYLAYYCFDLDYIDSLPRFIEDNCGWKHMR